MNAKLHLFVSISGFLCCLYTASINYNNDYVQGSIFIINLIICIFNFIWFIEANVGIILVDNGFTIYKKERK
jgi:hypothetical protein